MNFQKNLAALDELKAFLAEQAGEEMKGMPMDGEEEEEESEHYGMGEEKPALAIAIEAPEPKSGGDSDMDSLIAKGLASSDPTVKAMAEALSKAKAKTPGTV